MSMKRYKKLLFQVGILLFLCGAVIYFLEQKKQFVSYDFTKLYGQNKSLEISGFEDGDRWQGNYSYDSERVFEGNSSVTLSSWYGKENSIQSNQPTPLPVGYSKGYMSIYVADEKNLLSLASLTLTLSGEDNQEKKYDLTSLVSLGWTRIAIALPNWKRITKKSFSIVSKTGEIAEVNLDRFWVENTSAYLSDVLSTKSHSLSLRTIGDRTYLFSASSQMEHYTITTPATMRRGTITVALIPEHGKGVQFSLNGTSMKIAGKNMDECSLYKNGNQSSTKILAKTSGKNDLYVFIKAELKYGTVIYSISNNDLDFETCGSVASSQKTPIQLSLQGSFLIDSYSAEY